MSITKVAATTAVFIISVFIGACSADNNTVANSEYAILTVYKSPTCGCCGAWVEHANTEGFSTIVENVDNLQAIKSRFGIKSKYAACHTIVSADGYVFEGHIPAKAIEKFLAEKPDDAMGLAVPGMPMGSPGMEQNDSFAPYQVVKLMKDGSSVPYMTISTQKDQYK